MNKLIKGPAIIGLSEADGGYQYDGLEVKGKLDLAVVERRMEDNAVNLRIVCRATWALWLLLLVTISFISIPVTTAAELDYGVIELYEAMEQLKQRITVLEAKVLELDTQLNPVGESTVVKPSLDTQVKGAWFSLAPGWVYRNPIMRDGFLPTLVVDIRRLGDKVEMVIFQVTLFDDQGDITGTGSGILMNGISTYEVKTVEFILTGDLSSVTSIRLQVDSSRV